MNSLLDKCTETMGTELRQAYPTLVKNKCINTAKYCTEKRACEQNRNYCETENFTPDYGVSTVTMVSAETRANDVQCEVSLVKVIAHSRLPDAAAAKCSLYLGGCTR